MIALDTNVLVRLITRDDAEQVRRTDALVAAADEPFFLADIVLAELSWVLARGYGFSRLEVAEVLTALIDRLDIVFEDEQRVRTAVRHYRDGLDLADGLILGAAKRMGCRILASFDDAFCRVDPKFVQQPR